MAGLPARLRRAEHALHVDDGARHLADKIVRDRQNVDREEGRVPPKVLLQVRGALRQRARRRVARRLHHAAEEQRAELEVDRPDLGVPRPDVEREVGVRRDDVEEELAGEALGHIVGVVGVHVLHTPNLFASHLLTASI